MSDHCVILTSEFPPLAIGGVGRYVSEIAWRLQRIMRVTVMLVPTYQPLTAKSLDPTPGSRVEVARVEYGSALSDIGAATDFRPILAAARAVAAQCSEYIHYSEKLVIYVQDYALAPIAAELRERFPHATVLAACHLPVYAGFTYFDKPVSDAIHQVLEAKLVQLAHHVIVPSAFAAHVLTLTHNVPNRKLAVIPLGVSRPEPMAEFPAGPLRLLAVGRSTEQKGYHFLFEIVRRLRQWDDSLGLTIVTGTEGGDRLTMLARRYGVMGQIDFEHPIPHAAMWSMYDRHHLLVTTSLYETFGLAVLEAMASGRPTLGFAVGALPELWGTALATALGTPVACVDRLVSRLKAVAVNPHERTALSRSVEQRACAFSWTRHVERLTALMRGTSYIPAPTVTACP
jgi:glycosyltransferase involved in cell wall biosynthesis